MKKLFLLGCIAMVSLLSFAQNNEGTNDDAARIAMTPYVDPSLNFNNEVCKQLNNKMSQILTKQGLAGMYNQRFIITCNADILSEDIVVTTKEMYQYELGVNFIVGDGIEGVKFAMASQNVKGLGETKAAAYLAAIKKIKPNDPVFHTLLLIVVETALFRNARAHSVTCNPNAAPMCLSVIVPHDGVLRK